MSIIIMVMVTMIVIIVIMIMTITNRDRHPCYYDHYHHIMSFTFTCFGLPVKAQVPSELFPIIFAF